MSDLVKFEQGVKDRVKAIVGELIPEAMYDAIVQGAITQFKTVDIPRIVKEELELMFRTKIKEEMMSSAWCEKWNSNYTTSMVSDMVRKILIDAAPEMWANFIGASAQQIVNQLRYNR